MGVDGGMTQVSAGRSSSSFRSNVDRFHDAASYRKGRCRREANDYRDLGPGKYDCSYQSFMELQQTRPNTMGSIVLGGRSNYRSTVYRKEINWYLGREDYPHLGPGVYHQPSRSFLGKKDAVVYLPGSRRGFHTFLNSGRSKRMMGDAVLFQTARGAGQHLGPGSYDLPCTLSNGIKRPKTASQSTAQHRPIEANVCPGTYGPAGTRVSGSASRLPASHNRTRGGATPQAILTSSGWRGVRELPEERTADVNAVRALPGLR